MEGIIIIKIFFSNLNNMNVVTNMPLEFRTPRKKSNTGLNFQTIIEILLRARKMAKLFV